MKPDYKNWMPKGMVLTAVLVTVVCLVLLIIFGLSGITAGALRIVLFIIFLILTVFGACVSIWMTLMYRAFSYDGRRQMSKQIIEGIADCVNLPDGAKGLDVGCGSGALTIACAKRNPETEFIGIDRWGREYASFNKPLCEKNAKSECVSNYVYHNIPTDDRQAVLLETLRVLKKGGTFALHDIFSKSKYGDMQMFVQKLKTMGYEEVQLIDTTNGRFMMKREAAWMALSGSALLIGRK